MSEGFVDIPVVSRFEPQTAIESYNPGPSNGLEQVI